jgi:radical SAM superfamily enzyme YgiQ (UPF0313 family)
LPVLIELPSCQLGKLGSSQSRLTLYRNISEYDSGVNNPDILLATLNARYSHTNLALRCLMANLGPLQARARLIEFVIDTRTEVMVEKLLACKPRVIAFSVYVWNVEQTTRVVQLLKVVAPQIKVILGGPEVSHETELQRICHLADHVVTGPGESAFTRLCQQLLHGPPPLMKIIAGEAASTNHLATLKSPYPLYTDEDLAHRLTYIEASRGCPFKCEFCLSALDKTAWPFALEQILSDLAKLYERGARTFKFIDRTFNLKVDTSLAILQFFLDRQSPADPVFAHFEVIPDHLPDALKTLIQQFPPGALQFEIGIQSLNSEVQKRISRRQDNVKAEANVRWLAQSSQVHLHLDLIAGLPGESLQSFGQGFDQLVAWLGLDRAQHHDIQVGILKRLRGTPIIRHTDAFELLFNPNPPYNVLSTSSISFEDMRRMERFARYWDLIANREIEAESPASASLGATRVPERILPRILGQQPFERFMALSDWIYKKTDTTFRIEKRRLQRLVNEWLDETNEPSFGQGTD